ncbi:cyclic-di-AMP-binding protein CbpB [Ligilactobacillus cholophilus]|uniref:cyclic-di-AMP-binding protein CbpB n=1 Tax=Ligilactobacillus cholophilus TaxID=3050131 RepID=UPI0025B13941|nr:cyclic-di-AMP-binding protein CbpB [Ligilactobacillus cholophilus]
MIAKSAADLINKQKEHFLISADQVANVFEKNHLDHAFLVLTKIGYSKIPVLDKDQHFKGLISLSMITESMLGLNGIDPSNLSQRQVCEVMQKDVPVITDNDSLEEVLHLLVDQPFLVVVDSENIFKGIITRRELMKAINYMVHELDKKYEVNLRENLS